MTCPSSVRGESQGLPRAAERDEPVDALRTSLGARNGDDGQASAEGEKPTARVDGAARTATVGGVGRFNV